MGPSGFPLRWMARTWARSSPASGGKLQADVEAPRAQQAASRMSARLVAAITTTPCRFWNPSRFTRRLVERLFALLVAPR